MMQLKSLVCIGLLALSSLGCSSLISRGLCHSQTDSTHNAEKADCRELVEQSMRDSKKNKQTAKDNETTELLNQSLKSSINTQ
jgi:hypothetical protein